MSTYVEGGDVRKFQIAYELCWSLRRAFGEVPTGSQSADTDSRPLFLNEECENQVESPISVLVPTFYLRLHRNLPFGNRSIIQLLLYISSETCSSLPNRLPAWSR